MKLGKRTRWADAQLMKPEEAARVSAKNSRTIVKIMQLMDLRKSRPSAEAIDKKNGAHLQSRIGKYMH
jgi:hypothetical protein